MPFGIKNGPADFNRAVLGNFQDMRSEVEVYFDDIIPHTNNDVRHLEVLNKVFARVRELHMKLNLSKCKFFNLKVKCLGYILSYNKIEMDQDKICVVRDWPTPSSKKHVESFLGLTGYYRKFINGYAELVAPLMVVKRKGSGQIHVIKF